MTVEERQEARKKRYKDYVKTVLKKFNTEPNTFETDASNRSLWRSLCRGGTELFEEKKRDEHQTAVTKLPRCSHSSREPILTQIVAKSADQKSDCTAI